MGCGWLGLPLAQHLVQLGETVYGTTTRQEKHAALTLEGIQPYTVRISEKEICGDIDAVLSKVTKLVINVPPKLRGQHKENFVVKIKLLYQAIKKHPNIIHVIFVSSTAVYDGLSGTVNETTALSPSKESGKQLLAAEALFAGNKTYSTTILRFGGLINDTRHPAQMLSGKSGLTNGNDPINLIHLNDCIQIITALVYKDPVNAIINGVAPQHPPKAAYYTQQAARLGVTPPKYIPGTPSKNRIVASTTLVPLLGYSFSHGLYI